MPTGILRLLIQWPVLLARRRVEATASESPSTRLMLTLQRLSGAALEPRRVSRSNWMSDTASLRVIRMIAMPLQGDDADTGGFSIAGASGGWAPIRLLGAAMSRMPIGKPCLALLLNVIAQEIPLLSCKSSAAQESVLCPKTVARAIPWRRLLATRSGQDLNAPLRSGRG